jgi:hypothetical protein
LHTLDVPFLTARPVLRSALVVGLCGFGFAFSLTGVIVAWRRLRQCLRPNWRPFESGHLPRKVPR